MAFFNLGGVCGLTKSAIKTPLNPAIADAAEALPCKADSPNA